MRGVEWPIPFLRPHFTGMFMHQVLGGANWWSQEHGLYPAPCGSGYITNGLRYTFYPPTDILSLRFLFLHCLLNPVFETTTNGMIIHSPLYKRPIKIKFQQKLLLLLSICI